MPGARSAALVAALVMGLAPAAAAQPARRAPAAHEVKVNDFLSYDATARAVHVALIGAFGGANGGMNFNGGAKGSHTITVPVGWSVTMEFVNKDAIPHSAIVVRDTLPLPVAPEQPAIPRAYTLDVTAGLPTGGTDQMRFTPTKPGRYLIICGVPGHGPAGMYIRLVVSSRASAPSYES